MVMYSFFKAARGVKFFQIQRELSFNSAQSAKHCSWGQTVMASVMTMHYGVWISQFWALMPDCRSKASLDIQMVLSLFASES